MSIEYPRGPLYNKEPDEEGKLGGSLIDRQKLTGTGTLINKKEQIPRQELPETKIEVGREYEVKDLLIQTPVASQVYTGKITIIDIAEKGSTPPLKIGGKATGTTLPERFYHFKLGDTDQTGTVPESRLKDNLEKKS